mmetsp:Transcript_31608/g.62509  ORF Transcript_31608/g.62509 Transcript_31608/m.62509 type:complete len:346 (-) Transcript_31608:419-1456(-)
MVSQEGSDCQLFLDIPDCILETIHVEPPPPITQFFLRDPEDVLCRLLSHASLFGFPQTSSRPLVLFLLGLRLLPVPFQLLYSQHGHVVVPEPVRDGLLGVSFQRDICDVQELLDDGLASHFSPFIFSKEVGLVLEPLPQLLRVHPSVSGSQGQFIFCLSILLHIDSCETVRQVDLREAVRVRAHLGCCGFDGLLIVEVDALEVDVGGFGGNYRDETARVAHALANQLVNHTGECPLIQNHRHVLLFFRERFPFLSLSVSNQGKSLDVQRYLVPLLRCPPFLSHPGEVANAPSLVIKHGCKESLRVCADNFGDLELQVVSHEVLLERHQRADVILHRDLPGIPRTE